MRNIQSAIGRLLPTGLQYKLMIKFVKDNYATGKYNTNYRNHGRVLSDIEKTIIKQFHKKVCDVGFTAYPNILDLGCGDGALFDSFLVDLGCNLTGIDISKEQIEAAKNNCKEATYICGDFTKYNPGSIYDGITSFYSFYNIPRKLHKVVLKKVFRMLKPGGHMLINVRVDEVGPFDYWTNWCGKRMAFSYYDAKTFMSIAKEVGFSVTKFDITDHDEYVWLLLTA